MKKSGNSTTLVFPGATGWRVRLPTGQTTSVQALDEAAATLPAGASIHLALPCNAAVLERMTLPSVNRDELSGMVTLQLEKTLPYGVEEVSTDFDVIKQGENESTLISVAANHAQLDQLCEPLKAKAFVPEKVTLYAQHVAASCSPDETVLCLWPEDGQAIVAFCEHGKLGYAQILPSTDPTEVTKELSGVLLRAEMEGVPTDFQRIRIEQGCGGLRDHLAELLKKPVEVFSFDAPLPEPATNLVPGSWIAEMRRLESSGRLKGRLQIAAIMYLLLVAGSFLYLAWLKSRVQKLDAQIAETRPLVEFQTSRQAKWQDLAPALDPSRYMIEILNALFSNRPNSEVKFTAFEFKPKEFKVEVEAPNSSLWTEFTEKLRKDPALANFKIESPAPKFLADNISVQFTVYGKL
jgi:type II secretory pathway component PulL